MMLQKFGHTVFTINTVFIVNTVWLLNTVFSVLLVCLQRSSNTVLAVFIANTVLLSSAG
jgi:hypothetical protein